MAAAASPPAASPAKRQAPGLPRRQHGERQQRSPARRRAGCGGRAASPAAASPATAQSISAQRETPATASASARSPRRRSSSRRQQRSTAPGRARKAGSRSSGTQPARGTGEAQALAAMAIQRAGGSRRPDAPSRRGSLPGGARSRTASRAAQAAATTLAGEEGPQAKVPHQAPKRARSRGGARPDIVRHCRRWGILSSSASSEPSRRNPMTVQYEIEAPRAAFPASSTRSASRPRTTAPSTASGSRPTASGSSR